MAKKSKAVVEEITEAQLEQKLSEYATAHNELKRVEGELNHKITTLRDKYQNKVESLKEESDDLFTVIQFWVERNREQFEKKRSKELLHGKIGLRIGTPKLKTKKGFTWASVLVLVKSLSPNLIRVKEEIDKESIISKHKDEEFKAIISSIGVEVVQDESFFIELKEEDIIS